MAEILAETLFSDDLLVPDTELSAAWVVTIAQTMLGHKSTGLNIIQSAPVPVIFLAAACSIQTLDTR